jgi:deoxycytidylate deaminase
MSGYAFDWSNIAFGDKDKVSKLRATFIAAPRELSVTRLKQLIKAYLPKGNIVLGLAKETHVAGFEGQAQFRMLALGSDHQKVTDQVNAASKVHKIYTLRYFQRETEYIFDQLAFKQIILVNGSWKYTFHTQKPYYVLARKRLDYTMISPFASEAEAIAYEQTLIPTATIADVTPVDETTGSEADMLQAASDIAKQSYDNSFQTGVALGRKLPGQEASYKLLARTFNKVVPYQTYAMHHGASREANFSPPHDLNHYDTVHAEVELLIKAQKEQIDLRGTSLFINLLPCPSCSRMFCETDIEEFVYSEDHSAGYAVALLEKAGKTVRRVVLTHTVNS